MENVTPDMLLSAVVVLLAVCVAIATVGKALDVIKGWRKPRDEKDATLEKRMDQHETYLAADKHRLEAHEKELTDLHDGQRALCTGVQALLEHELHNGNSEQMQKASEGINKWLLDGR